MAKISRMFLKFFIFLLCKNFTYKWPLCLQANKCMHKCCYIHTCIVKLDMYFVLYICRFHFVLLLTKIWITQFINKLLPNKVIQLKDVLKLWTRCESNKNIYDFGKLYYYNISTYLFAYSSILGRSEIKKIIIFFCRFVEFVFTNS